MKKIMRILMLIIMTMIIAIPVLAADLSSQISSEKIQKGEKVKITFLVSDFEEIENDINVIEGKITYDKNIFEEVKQEDIQVAENWEGLVFNPENGKFIMDSSNYSNSEQKLLIVTLTCKENVSNVDTIIKLENVVASEGTKEITLEDISRTVTIYEEEENLKNGILPYAGEHMPFVYIGIVLIILVAVILIIKKRRQ